MAQRRMFSKEITSSDLFVDMPASAQLLYYHLGMEADDEGFIGNAKMLSRAYGMNNDDLLILISKGFIIAFGTGVTVIKDWNINNKIRNDRKKLTVYADEKSLLNIDDQGRYILDGQNDNQLATSLQPNDRIGKERLGKNSIGEVSKDILSSSDEQDDIPYKEIIDYLNEKAKTSYRSSSESTKKLIKARFNDGFTLDNFKTVIDKKCSSWLTDENMAKYLRPSTLFGTKFEQYLNEVEAQKPFNASLYRNSENSMDGLF